VFFKLTDGWGVASKALWICWIAAGLLAIFAALLGYEPLALGVLAFGLVVGVVAFRHYRDAAPAVRR
jgi:hypothetical protein